MSFDISPNTKATLLLTAPLIVGRRGGESKSSVRPLTFTEYMNLARQLRDCDKQPADLLTSGALNILEQCNVSFDNTQVTQLLRRGFQLSQALEHWATRSIWVVSHLDADYPSQIKARLGKSAPPIIYGSGNLTLLDNGGLAVVGSRDISDVLIEYAQQIGCIAAISRCSIVSGGARGVDQAAMRGALNRGGTAIGVLADDLERAVMHRENRDRLIDADLALISPYDPRAGFSIGNAMRRNKLIYALSDAGLVVNADHNKGGSWAGAVEQLDKLRLVPIYARADGEVGKGLEALLGRGARPWPNPETPDEFRLALSGKKLYSETESLWKKTFLPDLVDIAKSSDGEKVTPSNRQTDTSGLRETPPADALFAKVEDLLKSIDTPTTESDVAAYLRVSKSQAREWMKRLVMQGRYKRSIRPVRYERIS